MQILLAAVSAYNEKARVLGIINNLIGYLEIYVQRNFTSIYIEQNACNREYRVHSRLERENELEETLARQSLVSSILSYIRVTFASRVVI